MGHDVCFARPGTLDYVKNLSCHPWLEMVRIPFGICQYGVL